MTQNDRLLGITKEHNKPLLDALQRFGLLDELEPEMRQLLEGSFIDCNPPTTLEAAQAYVRSMRGFCECVRQCRRKIGEP